MEVSQSSPVDLGKLNPSGDDVHRLSDRWCHTGLALPESFSDTCVRLLSNWRCVVCGLFAGEACEANVKPLCLKPLLIGGWRSNPRE